MPDGPHVLIVEDELIVGVGLQSLLTEFGFASFAFASTDGQALAQARLRCPDLITIDLGLMAGDGAQAVRAIEAEYGKLPVIYVTGSPDAAPSSPEAVVLSKPVSRAGLARALRRLDCLPSERPAAESSRRSPGPGPSF